MRRGLVLAWVVGFAAALGAQPPVRPAITGIAFARFYTTDAAEAEKFYGGTLGYTREEQHGMLVYPVNRSQWIELVAATPPDPRVRMAAVGFTTRDARGLERYLAAHGVKLESPLKDGEFSVRDPEGNLVYFVQRDSNKSVAAAKPSPNAASRRMIHVGFVVHDADKENAFWREIVGFRPYWHGGHNDTSTDYISQQVPDGTDWLEYMLNPSPTPTLRQNGSADHLSLGVAHMEDVVAALARNGCEGASCTSSKLGRDGKMQLNLFDPDSTRIEFMEFTPTREPCCSAFTGKHPGDEEDR
jgi:catechol 2,3-dioxygenase-like lactoylglutathione lyase family enzyme